MSGTSSITGADAWEQNAPNALSMVSQLQNLANASSQNQAIKAGIAQTQQTTALQAAQTNTAKYDLLMNQINDTYGSIGGFLSKPAGQLKANDVISTIEQRGEQSGMSPQMIASIVATVPADTNPDGSQNDSGLRGWVSNRYASVIPHQQALETLRATGQVPINYTGPGGGLQGATQGGPLAPNAGVITPVGQPQAQGLTPAEGATRVAGPPTPTGAPTQVPLASVTPRSMGGGAATPQAPPIGGTGGYRPPAAGTAPAGATPAPAPPAPPGAIPGQVTTGLPVGQPESIEANQKQYQADVADIPESQNRVRDLDIAYQSLKGAGTGYGSEGWQKVREVATTLGWAPDSTKDEATNYSLAKKYLTGYAMRSPTVASNQGLSEAMAANASTDIPNPAALTVVGTNIAKERFKQGQIMYQREMDPSGTGAGYLGNAADYAMKFDRRAFDADYAAQSDPTKYKSFLDGLKGNDRTKYFSSLAWARQHGLLGDAQAQ